jgi:hypothetical protein
MVKLKRKGTNEILAENGVELQFPEGVANMLVQDCWDLEIAYPEEHQMPWLYVAGVN